MRLSILISLCLLLFTACNKWAYKVPTETMEPTIRKGATIWVDHRYYSNHPIERFDIVLFVASAHGDPHQGKDAKIVKRVVGLGGEQIQLKDGKLFVNEGELTQPFDFKQSHDDFGPIRVPRGEYFLLGDNRDNSFDSRFWNPPTIKAAVILGKVVEIKEN